MINCCRGKTRKEITRCLSGRKSCRKLSLFRYSDVCGKKEGSAFFHRRPGRRTTKKPQVQIGLPCSQNAQKVFRGGERGKWALRNSFFSQTVAARVPFWANANSASDRAGLVHPLFHTYRAHIQLSKSYAVKTARMGLHFTAPPKMLFFFESSLPWYVVLQSSTAVLYERCKSSATWTIVRPRSTHLRARAHHYGCRFKGR